MFFSMEPVDDVQTDDNAFRWETETIKSYIKLKI